MGTHPQFLEKTYVCTHLGNDDRLPLNEEANDRQVSVIFITKNYYSGRTIETYILNVFPSHLKL